MSRPGVFVSISVLTFAGCDCASSSAPVEAGVAPVATETPPLELALKFEPRGVPTDEWIVFESIQDRFSAEFPRTPSHKKVPIPTEAGELEASSHEVESDDAYYMISTVDYPAEFVAASDPKSILDGARAGTVANIGGELLRERQLTVAGVPGRRLLIRASASGVEVNLDAVHCVIGRRLYQAVVIHKPDNPAEVERFLSSFEPRAAAR